jgi:hypothetical protein
MIVLTLMLALSSGPGPGLKIWHGDQGVRVPNDDILNVTQDLTLEAWIKPSGEPGGGGPFHFIVSKNYDGKGYDLLLIGNGDNCRIQFEMGDIASTTVPMSVLKWHWWHVAAVYRDRKSIALYINGVKTADVRATLPLRTYTGPLLIGTSPWDTFQGRIGDVRIWSVARTQEQVVDDMHSRVDPSSPGLVADYDLSNIKRGRVLDRSGKAPAGILLGGRR